MRYTLKFICLFILVFCLTDACIGAEKARDVIRCATMAIIDTSGNKLSNIVSLLTVRLSQELNINLVEREEINKVLEEVKLSASQLVSRENCLKLGHLLGADGLIFLSLSESKDTKALRVRLVDSEYGLRLLDELTEWKEGEIDRIVEETVPLIFKVSPKLLIPPEKEVLIGILGIRNVEPASRLNWLEFTLPGLISSKLSSEPNIIILEREDLNLVLEEKLFTKGPDSSFLGSMALLEGEVEEIRDKEEVSAEVKKTHKFRFKLELKQPDGKSSGEFRIDADTEKLPELTERIASWLTKTITDSPPQAIWDIKNEAQRFLTEGKILMGQGDYVAARPLIETAHALNRDMHIADVMIDVLSGCIGCRDNTKITPLERAQDVYYALDIHFGRKDKDLFMDSRIDNIIWTYLNSSDSVVSEEVKEFNKKTRRLYGRCLDSILENQSGDWDWKIHFAPIYPCLWASAVSDTPEEAMRRFKAMVSKLILSPKKGGWKIPEELQIEFLYSCFTVHHQCHILASGHLNREKVLKLWLSFLAELTKSDDPVVKIMAKLGLSSTFLNAREEELYPQVKTDCYEEVMKILIEELNYPDEPFGLVGRHALRRAIYSGTLGKNYHIDPEVSLERIEKLLKPLIDKGDVENLMLWRPFNFVDESILFSQKWDSALRKRILEIIDGMINTLENNISAYRGTVITMFEGNHTLYNRYNNEPEEEISSLKIIRTKFLQRYPGIGTNTILSTGLKISILYDIANYMTDLTLKNDYYLCMRQATIEGRMLWIPLAGQELGVIGLIGINMEDKSFHSFWYTSFPAILRNNVIMAIPIPKHSPSIRQGRGVAVGKDDVYLSVFGKGIVKFPITHTQGIECLKIPEVITEKDGLPSNKIMDIAYVSNKLYVSIGAYNTESGFGVYDLVKREWKTISSSRSKDKACPLNNERPYEIFSLTPTSDGKKLFFVCEQEKTKLVSNAFNLKSDPDNLSGLWKMYLESGKIEQIWRGNSVFNNIIPGEKNWWIRGRWMLMAFDPDSERGKMIVNRLDGRWVDKDILKPTDSTRQIPDVSGVYSLKEIAQDKLFHIENSALFRNNFWVLKTENPGQVWGRGIPWCIFIKQPLSKAKEFGIDILGEGRIAGFLPTPYGVVVLGENKIGLIEENPEP